MTRVSIVRGAIAAAVVLGAGALGYLTLHRIAPPAAPPSSPSSPMTDPSIAPTAAERKPTPAAQPSPESAQGFLYGRITTVDGAVYEGRLRWGGSEEAFWSDAFNGVKVGNPWLPQVAPEQRPRERHPIALFGIEIAARERPSEVRRPFMARFGELARIEARGDEVRVTLKSGAVVDLDRFDASDFDDGVRVWDTRRGVVDLDSLRIRILELLPTPALADVPSRLHGTVRTSQGDYTGFVAWNRADCVGSDELAGRTAQGKLSLRFDTIRAIARRASDGAHVTLLDGRELELSGTAEVGSGNRGIYVDDRRFGRVLVSWEAFERVDFRPPGARGAGSDGPAGADGSDGGDGGEGGSGPAYGAFPAGGPLAGSVTTRDGRRLAGRLVFDLDESVTTDTLDAPSQGVDYSLPLGRIAALSEISAGAASVRVTLQDGEELQLERAGDLGEGNAGVLIFVDGGERPEYVPWSDVEQIAFDRPPAIGPPLGAL